MGEGRLRKKVRDDFLCLIFVGSTTKHKQEGLVQNSGVLFCLKGKVALKN